jgi:endonuclease/exonuclease/phosphatase (EEP) superfamily protein YafD
VLVGDLNATPESDEMKPMYANYRDAIANQSEAYTYSEENPTKRIDYIFTSNHIETKGARVIDSLASDHLPLMTELVLERYEPFTIGEK